MLPRGSCLGGGGAVWLESALQGVEKSDLQTRRMPPKISRETLKKLQPKLRMIADGDATVNILRSERAAALAVESPASLKRMKEVPAGPTRSRSRTGTHREAARPAGTSTRVTDAVRANVFVYLRDPEVETPDDRPAEMPQGRDRAGAGAARRDSRHRRPRRRHLCRDRRDAEDAGGDGHPTPRRSRLRPANAASASAAQHKFGEERAHRHHRRAGLRLQPSRLPRRRRQDALRAHLGSGRRGAAVAARARRRFDRQFEYGAEFQAGAISTRRWPRRRALRPAGDRHRAAVAARRGFARHARRQHRRRQSRRVPRRQIAGVLISLPQEDEDQRAVVLRLEPARRRGRLPAAARRADGTAGVDQREPRHQRPRARRQRRRHALDRRRARRRRAAPSPSPPATPARKRARPRTISAG